MLTLGAGHVYACAVLLYADFTVTLAAHARRGLMSKVGDRCIRAVAGAWCMAGCLGHNYGHGWASQRGPHRRPSYLSQASCMIVSGFTAALDLDTYPLIISNFIHPRCAIRAKPGRGKPVLIMHIGFFACFHDISLERSRFRKIATLIFLPL